MDGDELKLLEGVLGRFLNMPHHDVSASCAPLTQTLLAARLG